MNLRSVEKRLSEVFLVLLFYPLTKCLFTNRLRDKYDDLINDLVIDLVNYASLNSNSVSLLDFGAGGKPHQKTLTTWGIDYFSAEIRNPFSNLIFDHDFEIKVDSVPDIPDEAFDCVLSTSVLEHVPYPNLTILELNRVLKEEGMLFLSTNFNYKEHGAPFDFYRFSVHGLKQILNDANFEIININTSGGRLECIHHDILKGRINSLQILQVQALRIRNTTDWVIIPFFVIKLIWAKFVDYAVVLPVLSIIRIIERLMPSNVHYSGISVVAKKVS